MLEVNEQRSHRRVQLGGLLSPSEPLARRCNTSGPPSSSLVSLAACISDRQRVLTKFKPRYGLGGIGRPVRGVGTGCNMKSVHHVWIEVVELTMTGVSIHGVGAWTPL
jgi:hypothetical protein